MYEIRARRPSSRLFSNNGCIIRDVSFPLQNIRQTKTGKLCPDTCITLSFRYPIFVARIAQKLIYLVYQQRETRRMVKYIREKLRPPFQTMVIRKIASGTPVTTTTPAQSTHW